MVNRISFVLYTFINFCVKVRRENKEKITITIIIIIIIEGSRLRASHLIIKLKPFISSAALHSVILKIIPANI